MNENAATARGLLIALRALGSVNRAEAFETAFERVNWDLDKQHIVELNAAIAEAEGVSVEAVQRPKSPARTDDLPDCLKLFEPFVIPIEGNRDILAALNELGRPGVGGHRVQAVRDLFTEVLGFEARNLDVRERLGSQKTITALLLIAEFDEFVVTVAHVDKVLPYSNVYQPVFRLFPYGLCVVLDTSGRIVRFVYSHGRDGDGARSISYRAFAGPAPGRSVNDNIVVWLKRFDLIRPAFGDDRSKVRDRVEAALSATPGDLAMRWPSGGLDPTQDLPGAQWGELPRVEADSFVQLHADDRIHWGLEAVLRDRFPMFGARKRAVLRYEGHHVDGGADEFHYRVTLKLRLEPASPADTTVSSSSLEVVCVIPKPDVHGRFVIEGVQSHFHPFLTHNGSLVARLLGFSDRELLEEYSELYFESDNDPDSVEVDDTEEEEYEETDELEPTIERDAIVEGASIRALMEVAVSRKLANLAHRFARLRGPDPVDEAAVSRVFAGVSNHSGYVELWSKPLFVAALTPVSDSGLADVTRVVLARGTGNPPAWSCLDASSVCPTGTWVPVAGARLHPCGEIAVPVQRDGKWRMTVSADDVFDVNGRAIGEEAGSPHWWVAPWLARWAHLPVGKVPDSRWILRRGGFGEQMTIVVQGKTDSPNEEIVECLVRSDYLAEMNSRSAVTRTLSLDIPSDWNTPPPVLARDLVGCNCPVGTRWLHVPAEMWRSAPAPEWPWGVRTVARLGEQQLPEPEYGCRIPVGFAGTVTRLSLDPVIGRFGQTVAWRAVLEVCQLPGYEAVVLSDGRCAALQPVAAEDTLFEADSGAPAHMTLRARNSADGCGAEGGWRDGHSGDVVGASALVTEVYWVPALPDVAVTAAGFRLIDNELAPEPDGVYLTEQERRWLRFAHPEEARALDARNARGTDARQPWEPALGAILRDLELEAGSQFVSDDSILDGPVQTGDHAGLTDTMRTALHADRLGGGRNVGGFLWQCECGTLTGVASAGRTCAKCETVVNESLAGAERWACESGAVVRHRNTRETCGECDSALTSTLMRRSELPRLHLSIPIPVLHPWRRTEAAAVLGLTVDELEQVLKQHGPAEVVALIEHALDTDATVAMSTRMDRENSAVRLRTMGAALTRLRSWLREGVGCLSLATVPVIPPRYLMVGLLPGAPRVVHGGLAERYRELRAVIAQADEVPPWAPRSWRLMSGLALQDAVDRLYGDCDLETDAIESLAGLARRIWPLSRRSELKTAVPGLERKSGRISVRKSPIREGIPLSDLMPRNVHSPATVQYWEVRDGLTRISGDLLLPLAGAIAGVVVAGLDGETLEELDGLGVRRDDDLAAIALRELLRGLAAPDARPDLLVELLDSNLPITLPGDSQEARRRVQDRLASALPPAHAGRRIALFLLGAALGGWWRGPISRERPVGWRYAKPSTAVGGEWTRAIPPLRSAAWSVWPVTIAFTDPIRWLRRNDRAVSLVRNAAGCLERVPRPAWWKVPDLKHPEIEPESLAESRFETEVSERSGTAPEPASATTRAPLRSEATRQSVFGSDAVVLDGTLSGWLRQQMVGTHDE